MAREDGLFMNFDNIDCFLLRLPNNLLEPLAARQRVIPDQFC